MINTTDLQRNDAAPMPGAVAGSIILPVWKQFLQKMSWVNLEQLKEYSLMRRFDTKYLVPEAELLPILSSIASTYSVLEVNGVRLNPYQTTYYDTSDFLFFRQHHNGVRNRCKVRTRTYLSTEASFLEIKQRQDNNQTKKTRIQIETQNHGQETRNNKFIGAHCPVAEDQLEAKLNNHFLRFTLVNPESIERVTVDLGLTLFNEQDLVFLPGVAVVEVKQAKLHDNTPLVAKLREAHLHPQGFSKYCVGISMLETQVKHNRFKKHLIQLNRMITKGNYSYGIS